VELVVVFEMKHLVEAVYVCLLRPVPVARVLEDLAEVLFDDYLVLEPAEYSLRQH
jgi:hypothetical protein